jgi:hypothetical protein
MARFCPPSDWTSAPDQGGANARPCFRVDAAAGWGLASLPEAPSPPQHAASTSRWMHLHGCRDSRPRKQTGRPMARGPHSGRATVRRREGGQAGKPGPADGLPGSRFAAPCCHHHGRSAWRAAACHRDDLEQQASPEPKATFAREVRTALALWSEHIRSITERSASKVVPMRKAESKPSVSNRADEFVRPP